jgi:hypothetical protein
MKSLAGLTGHVGTQTVVQGVDLGQFLAVFGSAGMALKRAAQEFHVSSRKKRAGAAWFSLRGIGVAHRVSL